MLFYKASVVLLIALAVAWLQWPWLSAVILSLVAYLLTGGWRFVRILYLTFWRDFSFIYMAFGFVIYSKKILKEKKTVAVYLKEMAKLHPNKAAFIFEGQKWTFQQVEDYSNKVANFFKSVGYKKGDVVAIFLDNKPEYFCLWLGLGKLGVISALINTNLRQDSLFHCINIAKVKSVVFGFELLGAVKEIKNKLIGTDLYSLGKTDLPEVQCLDQIFQYIPSKPPPLLEDLSLTDTLLYIYTSGTTGWPKAAPVSHLRTLQPSLIPLWTLNINHDDVLYITLPMYHTAATALGVVTGIKSGATLVLRRKFSASNFWKDCVEHKVTVTQYIGELCRYLLAQPELPSDKLHKIRGIHGNGMRPHIWKEFQDRFNIPKIVEFYGATEGCFATANWDGQIGSCGFQCGILPSSSRLFDLFQVDIDNCELKRDSDGMAIKCKVGEPGMAAGRIVQGTGNVFTGYVNDKLQSSKKLAQNIFKPGDTAFLSGDIMVMDELGYLYFKDRLGDTYRWKGENVATSEVESTIMKHTNHADVVVFGVKVPGTEGRAGMAAICDPDGAIDLKNLASDMKIFLPVYARPLFLRICHKVDLTGTFKLIKVKLKKEAFDPAVVQDSLYFMEPKSGQYLPLDMNVYQEIIKGDIRL